MNGATSVRLLAWFIAIALIALPIVGVLQGWFASDRWPVRKLEVQAEFSHVDAQTLRAAVLPSLRTGFFALDLNRVRDAVAAIPWVSRVEARKRWPDTLELRVIELHPVAHWGVGRLLGDDGRLFVVPGADAAAGLPQLAGPDDRVVDVVAFYQMAQRDFAPYKLRIDAVELSERGSWRLALSNGGALLVGRDQPEQRLARFVAAMPKLVSGHNGGFVYVDLRYSNGFAVKWTDAPVTLPAPESKHASPALPRASTQIPAGNA